MIDMRDFPPNTIAVVVSAGMRPDGDMNVEVFLPSAQAGALAITALAEAVLKNPGLHPGGRALFSKLIEDLEAGPDAYQQREAEVRS